MITIGCSFRYISSGIPTLRSKMPACRNCRWGRVPARKLRSSILPTAAIRRRDTWELYVDTDGRIQEIAYHGGGAAKFEVMATWKDYKKAGPLLLSLDHRGTHNGDPLRVSFSNVAIKLVGSNSWMDAQ